MSALIAAPDLIADATKDLATISSAVNAAHMAASAPTVSVAPAAADEVSASIAHLFSGYAQDYRALAGKAAAFHEQFVQHLTASAGAFASTESANAALLQSLSASAGSAVSASISAQTIPSDLLLNAFAFYALLLTPVAALLPLIASLGPVLDPAVYRLLLLPFQILYLPFLFGFLFF